MTEQEKNQSIQYALSLRPPAEVDFLSAKQLEAINQDRQKMASTDQFLDTILKADDFEEKIEKATIEGRIFNPSQYAAVRNILEVVEDGFGDRADIPESLVTPSGQRVIMSNFLADRLGFVADGYMLKDETEDLLDALYYDGVSKDKIDKVKSAMEKYGAVVLQNGIFKDLKGLLQDSLGSKIFESRPKPTEKPANAIPTPPKLSVPHVTPPPAPKPVLPPMPPKAPAEVLMPKPITNKTELPLSFIEFLKQNDKDYDGVEREVVNDAKFKEFFSNLQHHYTYYKSLPADKMAHELIIRPQLWLKLSPATQMVVQAIVEKHRDEFSKKVTEIAQDAHLDKLINLKHDIEHPHEDDL